MFIGQKKEQLYNELMAGNIPSYIKTYCEPFGGSFKICKTRCILRASSLFANFILKSFESTFILLFIEQ
jgi:hypothetical protein